MSGRRKSSGSGSGSGGDGMPSTKKAKKGAVLHKPALSNEEKEALVQRLADLKQADNRTGPTQGLIKNKQQRREVFKLQKQQKRKDRRETRNARKELREKLGSEAPAVPEQRTIENMRVNDGTVVDADDEEVKFDEATDEFASFYDGKTPKVVVTTSNKAVGKTYKFAEELINVIPNAVFRPRRGFTIKKIVEQASAKGFTDLIIINEDNKQPNMMLVIHLPGGPSAYFKLTSVALGSQISGHGKATMHYPEIITSGFSTRLGQFLSRMFTSLFPQRPEFEGRSVVTFHTQRDFIFFRRHRYVFRSAQRVGTQELGPRFTLKLQSLQKGAYDSKFGEYEFLGKNKFYVDRKKHYL